LTNLVTEDDKLETTDRRDSSDALLEPCNSGIEYVSVESTNLVALLDVKNTPANVVKQCT